MNTYTKKSGLSSKEKKFFAKKRFYTLSKIWKENRLSLMREFLSQNKMFDYNLLQIKANIEKTNGYITTLKIKRNLLNDDTIIYFQKIVNEARLELSKAKTKKLQILEAEVFWRFFIKNSKRKNSHEIFELLQEIKSNTENSYLKITCDVLSIPPSVWNELLWRENIDFQSYESFLRRLKPKQSEAIEKASIEMFEEKKVPSVFNNDKLVRKLFKKVPSYKSLLEESHSYNDKYLTKGAFSYDLFNMDFGYGRYPNGVMDDTEVIEKDLSKFISLKNHVNDFVVNKRDGIYWYLYQKVRSNYVYRENREVKLSTHICPGFWYTLIMNLFFWIISPIALLSFIGNYNQLELSVASISTAIIASFTSIWILLAIIKFSFLYIIQLFIDIIDDLSKKVELSSEEKAIKKEMSEKRKSIYLRFLKVLIFSFLFAVLLFSEAIFFQLLTLTNIAIYKALYLRFPQFFK